jgi:hypothetical protein
LHPGNVKSIAHASLADDVRRRIISLLLPFHLALFLGLVWGYCVRYSLCVESWRRWDLPQAATQRRAVARYCSSASYCGTGGPTRTRAIRPPMAGPSSPSSAS